RRPAAGPGGLRMSDAENNQGPVTRTFDSVAEAERAIEELLRAGVERGRIEVRSSEPVHFSDAASARLKQSWVWLYAIGGGMAGCVGALLLTIIASRRVNLVTGGMPISSAWTFGAIVFEMTALGAVLFSVGRMIFESGLVRRRPVDEHCPTDAEIV